MQMLQVAMLGPRAVGKTSLLAAMYQEFQTSTEEAALQLSLDGETAAVLQERLIDLKNLVRGGTGVPMTSGELGLESLRRQGFLFRLGDPGSRPKVELRFKDFPGGFMSSQADAQQREFVQHLVFQSTALVVPVDAPALMEANGQYHEMANRPMEVTEFIKLGFENLQEPRLVILAPTKCEKYMKDPELANLLLTRIKDEYRELFTFLASDRLKNNVAVAITPVQTVGEMVFARVEHTDKGPKFVYKPLPRARYSPKDSEQPLRYLLSFLLNLHVRKSSWGSFNFLRDLFGMDRSMKNAAQVFARGLKTNDGFAIIQGQQLLMVGD
jgi:hypothetical protein